MNHRGGWAILFLGIWLALFVSVGIGLQAIMHAIFGG